MGTLKRMIERRLTKAVTSFYDPLVDLAIGNQTIKIPLSHPLRQNVDVHPYMNHNLGRLALYISKKRGNVKVIDIGANVGDTVAYIKNYVDAPVLCIDGDKKYLDILKQNVAKYSNVASCLTMVGSENKSTNLALKKERGTAFVTESAEANTMRTIDNILEEFPSFSDSSLVKVDTDGFDTIILKACAEYLKARQPILYFEFDPYLARIQNDDPFSIVPYLKECGYEYIIFYMSNGEYLLSCTLSDDKLVNEMVHFFSGRKVELYTDICAFSKKDKDIYDLAVAEEVAFFRRARNY